MMILDLTGGPRVSAQCAKCGAPITVRPADDVPPTLRGARICAACHETEVTSD